MIRLSQKLARKKAEKESSSPELARPNHPAKATGSRFQEDNAPKSHPSEHAAVSTAVILAAGSGTRLRELHRDQPKGLLPIGGVALIEHSLERLAMAGVNNVVLITGYCASAYDAFLGQRFPHVRTIHNPDFARTGSMHSLWLARSAVAADFLLLESDLLYERRALSALLEKTRGDYILLSGTTRQGDEVFCYGADSTLRQLTKNPRAGETPVGEFVGISRLTSAFFGEMCRHYESTIRFPSNYHYDDCLDALAASHHIGLVKVDNLIWGEIDDPAHYRRVLDHVLPALTATS